MKVVANRYTAVLDACVILPARKRDFLFSFHKVGLYRARWTKEIDDEWHRNLIKLKPELHDRIDRLRSFISNDFEDCYVENYSGLAADLELPDEDDRHVIAAAIRCGAQAIVTDNLKDFPTSELEKYDIEAVTPDTFLSQTFELFPVQALSAVKVMRSRLKKSPQNVPEFIMSTTAAGLPRLAGELRKYVDYF